MSEPVQSDGLALPPPVGLSVERLRARHPGELVYSFPIATTPEFPEHLTLAERAVVAGLLRGESHREIAEQRGVSPFTVANQIARIFAKLGVHSRLDLALLLWRVA